MEQQREIEPFDVEAQRRIEENMQHALEHSPESFGRVNLLYIPVETISLYSSSPSSLSAASIAFKVSPECAEACGIRRLVDNRLSGLAQGVGTANILGRVHSAPLKLADLSLACSFTIMDSCGYDKDLFILGLDVLKAHQACIDLEKNVLRLQGREVRFLSEHELRDEARNPKPEPSGTGPSSSTPSGNDGRDGSDGHDGSYGRDESDGRGGSDPAFPRSGQALGTRRLLR